MLNGLRDRGVLALLDDFGTGFSALSYLHRFPIQALKIDQSFVAGLGGEMHAESLALVRAILALAGTLGIDAIGEGVETREQRDILRQRSEEHTSELQSLMRRSHAVLCLKQKTSSNMRQHNSATEHHGCPWQPN